MIRKRINTDLFLRLSVVMKDGSPANFTGAENMKVVIWHSLYSNIRLEQTFKVEKNVISVQFSSEENQKTGRYGVSVFWSKKDPDSETGRRDYAVDFTEAFTIVPYSEQEDDGTIEYTGKVNQNPDGISGGGTVDLSDYYNKKEVDDKLKKKVDAESGKELSSCDYTQEEKDKLAGLANYDDKPIKEHINMLETKVENVTGLTISEAEIEVGVLKIGGENYKLFQRTVILPNVPNTQGEEQEYTIDPDPLGNDLYISASNLIVRDSEGGYYPASMSVKKIYINSSLTTQIVLQCDQTIVSSELKGMVTLNYIKYDFERVEFTVNIPSSIDKDAITLNFPLLKYDKKFAYSLIVDDCRVDSNKLFFLINQKWVDNEKYQHFGQEKTTGYIPDKTLGYTDGTGIEKRFTYGVACWPGMGNDYISDFMNPPASKLGKTYPYLIWDEVKPIMLFGNEIYFHDVDAEDQKNINDLLLGIEKAQNVTINKINTGMKVMVRPGGNDSYVEAAKLYPGIVFITTEGGNSTINSLKQDVDLQKGVIWRRNCDNITEENFIAKIDENSAIEAKWMCDFTHSPSKGLLEGLSKFNDVYGKEGNDTVWFATVDEIYEYWFIRKFTKVRKESVDNGVHFTLFVPKGKYFRHPDFTVQISGVSFVENCISSFSDNVIGLSYGNINEKLSINLNLNENLLSNSEKFTSLYESSAAEEDRADALYFINQLREDLREAFLKRLSSEGTAPVLNAVVLNSGNSVTYEQKISVVLDITGGISYYKISESSNLSSIEWKEGTSKTLEFDLSSGFGSKIVYVQVKNQFGESSIKSASISYQEKPITMFTVTGKSNNNSYGTVTPASQNVAQGGTANLSAVAKSGYVIESWSGASSSTGVESGTGTAIVTNVQKDTEVICNFKSDAPPVVSEDKWIISMGWPYDEATYDSSTGITRQQGSSVYKDLWKTDGVKSGQVILKYNGVSVAANMTKNQSKRGYITGDDSGVYPDVYIANMVSPWTSTIEGENPTATVGFKLMPSGTYRVKIFSSNIAADYFKTGTLKYQVNDIEIEKPANFVIDNASEFVVFDNVVITNGEITLKAIAPAGPGMNPINIIEIEKVG